MAGCVALVHQLTARKSDSIGNGVGLAGELPYRADERRAALHAAVRNILKIVRSDAIRVPRGCDGGDRHAVSAMLTGKQQARQKRGRNDLEAHGTLTFRVPQTPLRPSPDQSGEESMNICAMHNLCAPRLGIGFNRVYPDGADRDAPSAFAKLLDCRGLRQYKFPTWVPPQCRHRRIDKIG